MTEDSWETSRFTVRSLVVGGTMMIVGLIVVWIATRQSSAPLSAFLAGIGTTLITVGLLDILYESYLKRGLINDIRDASRLESELYNIGLRSVTLERDVLRMRDYFSAANSIDIVPLHPLTWLDSESPWLTSLARQRQLKCRVYLPEPISYSSFLSSIPGHDTLTTPEHCSAKFNQYAKYWNPEDPNLHQISIEIHYYLGYPQAGFTISENSAIVHVGSSQRTAVDYISYAYRGQSAKPTIERIRHIIAGLNASPVSGTSEDTRGAEEILPTTKEELRYTLQTVEDGSIEGLSQLESPHSEKGDR